MKYFIPLTDIIKRLDHVAERLNARCERIDDEIARIEDDIADASRSCPTASKMRRTLSMSSAPSLKRYDVTMTLPAPAASHSEAFSGLMPPPT